MVKTSKAKTSTAKKTKVFFDPDVRDFLYNDWLIMSYFEGKTQLPKFLEELGMYGYITAFRKTDNEITFVYDKQFLTMRFFDKNKETEENTCLIPNFGSFNNDFAVVEDNSWTFYELDYAFTAITPRFVNYRFKNGRCSREISQTASTLRNTFVSDKLSGSKVVFNIEISNNLQDAKRLDNLMENILSILDTGNPKDISLKYEKLRNLVQKISLNYDVMYVTSNGEITDSVTVRNGKVMNYTITFDGKRVSLNRDHSWEFTSGNMSVSRNGDEINFSCTSNEYELEKIEKPKNVVNEITDFIGTNMIFIFD